MSEQPLYLLVASSAKHLMDSALHSEKMAGEAEEYWHREYFRKRAVHQRRTAWDFLRSARSIKRRLAA
jgi:N-glycosylase/DNA lyase